jgi:thiamine transporter ThiT
VTALDRWFYVSLVLSLAAHHLLPEWMGISVSLICLVMASMIYGYQRGLKRADEIESGN